jgi:hypothetical protein
MYPKKQVYTIGPGQVKTAIVSSYNLQLYIPLYIPKKLVYNMVYTMGKQVPDK